MRRSVFAQFAILFWLKEVKRMLRSKLGILVDVCVPVAITSMIIAVFTGSIPTPDMDLPSYNASEPIPWRTAQGPDADRLFYTATASVSNATLSAVLLALYDGDAAAVANRALRFATVAAMEQALYRAGDLDLKADFTLALTPASYSVQTTVDGLQTEAVAESLVSSTLPSAGWAYNEAGVLDFQAKLAAGLQGGRRKDTEVQRYPQQSNEPAATTQFEKFRSARTGGWSEGVGAAFWGAAFVSAYVNPVRLMTRDREYRLAEALQCAGLSEVAYRMSYMLRCVIVYGASALPPLLVYQAIGVFYSSDLFALWLCMVVFFVTATSFAAFASTFFSKSSLSTLVALLAYGLCLALGAYVSLGDGVPNQQAAILASCLLPPAYLMVLITAVFHAESDAAVRGVRFSTLCDTFSADGRDFPPVAALLAASLAGAFVFELLTAFAKACRSHGARGLKAWLRAGGRPKQPAAALEGGGDVLMRCDGLVKEFTPAGGQTFAAVGGVSLEVRRNEIVGLLGHNGAGKTTLVSLLTGSLAPTSGTVSAAPNAAVGVCPQCDIIFDALSVLDHVVLFAALQGVPLFQLRTAAASALDEVGLLDKQHCSAPPLSGGQKRKLAVACAFVGDPAVCFLDEPTSGMDPAARRKLWALLAKKKTQCGIVLTTHFLEEADLLSDRVVMLHGGRVCAQGTPLALKARHGKGYTLTFLVSPDCDVQRLTQHLESGPLRAAFLERSAGEVTYRVDGSCEELAAFLDRIDAAISSGTPAFAGVQSYGLSMATLEAVFLEVEQQLCGGGPAHDAGAAAVVNVPKPQPSSAKAQPPSALRQSAALLYKRLCCARRDVKGLLFVFVFPLIFVGIGVVAKSAVGSTSVLPRRVGFAPPFATYAPEGVVVGSANASELTKLTHALGRYLAPGAARFVLAAREDFVEALNGSSAGVHVDGGAACVFFNATANNALPLAMHLWLFGTQPDGPVVAGEVATMPGSPYTTDTTGEMLMALCLAVALAFLPSASARFVVRERECGVLMLQLMAGVTRLQYWTTTAVADIVWDVLGCSLIAALLAAGGAVEGGADVWALYVSMLLYSVVATLLSYVVSFCYSESGRVHLSIASWLFGLSFCFVVADLSVGASTGAGSTASEVVSVVFASLSPVYGITKCYLVTADFLGSRTYWAAEGGDGSLFADSLLGRYHRILLYQLGAYAALLAAVEALRRWPWLRLRLRLWLGPRRAWGTSELQPLGAGAAGGLNAEPAIELQGLAKTFGRFTAVDGVWLSIPKRCCFGLLGTNGAGKTTTIKMLTGETAPTSGSALFHLADPPQVFDAVTASSTLHRHIGVCPQTNPLLGEMTGLEMLTFFCMLRGVPVEQADDFLALVGIERYGRKPCGTYSGGNKRKLCVALALVGAPDVVFLDEPSSGVDPKSRRALWNVVKDVARTRTVVLTSHSLEEIDALCGRIAVMTGGTVRQQGTPQGLRSLLQTGYSVHFEVAPPELAPEVVRSAAAQLPGFTVVEEHCGRLVAEAPPGVKPSALLTAVGTQRGVVDCAVSQPALERVFLSIVEASASGGPTAEPSALRASLPVGI